MDQKSLLKYIVALLPQNNLLSLLNFVLICIPDSVFNFHNPPPLSLVILFVVIHHRTTRCSCQNFYKTELNKEEMYIRYIHKLYDLHLKAQNYTGTPKE